MARSETRNLVIATLAVHLNVSEQRVTEDAELVEDLGADSLDYVELVLEFEEMFHVEIPDDDLEQLLTVGNFIDLIDKKVSMNMQEEQEVPQEDPKLPDAEQADEAEKSDESDGEDDGEGEDPEEE